MSSEIEIRHVESVEEARLLTDFFNSVWVDGDDVVPLDVILAAVHVNGYAVLALDRSGVIAGSFGFQGTHDGRRVLHSHATAATVSGVGWMLKQQQREWARREGLDAITWTFDPLVRRNCVFNFEKLGATAIEYLPNFYGSMGDSINAGDESDRFFAYWPVLEQRTRIRLEDDFPTLLINDSGIPLSQAPSLSSPFWVQLPADIESMRHENPLQARQWRNSVRQHLAPAFENGWVVGQMNESREAFLVRPAN